ncbi:MAG TPA: hypothetical protein VNM14_22890 [Planctomycetota bacterium]|jgi:hypothetical protein|nr:hypothetical protein [Planctomycetota bacterium]
MKGLSGAVLFLLASPAFAQDEHVGVRVREWFARMSGSVEADDGSGSSDRLDLADDLGLGDRNLTHEIQAYLRIPVIGRIYAGWWRAHDSGSETVQRTFDFEGVQFQASSRIDSDVTLDVAYLNYEFAFPTIPIGDLVRVEFGAQLGVRALHGRAVIDDSLSGEHADKAGTVGLPTLGAHVTATLFTYVRAEVEVLGLAFSYGDWSMHYFEASAEIVAQPLPWLFGGVGYKVVDFHFKQSGSKTFDLDAGVSGLYLTFGVRF